LSASVKDPTDKGETMKRSTILVLDPDLVEGGGLLVHERE